jgi:cbb3-type cytochrome oxidase maturation protein
MSVLILLVPLALLLSVFFLGTFLFANHKDQWEDVETPAHTPFQEDQLKEKLNEPK